MTSKEAIKELRQYNSVGLCGDKTLFEPIEKDLEILEILKKNANLYVNDVNKAVKSIQINITTCDDNFNKVEELFNEKKV